MSYYYRQSYQWSIYRILIERSLLKKRRVTIWGMGTVRKALPSMVIKENNSGFPVQGTPISEKQAR
jgi:hypothetical protein